MATEFRLEIISIVLVFFFFYVGYLIFFRIKRKQVHQEAAVTTVELCPKCGSWKRDITNPWTLGFLPPEYVCQECGFKGNFVLVEHDKIRDFRNKLKPKKRKTKRVSTKK